MGSYLSYLIPAHGQKTIDMPFKNKQIEDIAKKFLLKPQDMIFFHQVFRKMDKLGNGYISEDNMFEFVQEEKTSVLSPYITKLFQLIEKENTDRVCFIEWVPAICAFCLFTHEQIIKFVFGMIDDDHDEVISKKDIIKFLVKERYGEKVFPFNQVRAIEIQNIERADRIKFEQFIRIEQQIPFLCYPAFRLQEIFKEQIKGNAFWKKVFQQIQESDQERDKKKQAEIINEEVKKKRQIEFAKKEQIFQQFTQHKIIEQNIFKPNFLENTRISLQDRTFKFPRRSSVQRFLTQQNQDIILIDFKSAVNPRRMSDGMIDIVFQPPKQSRGVREESTYYGEEIKKFEMPVLEYQQLKRVNSSLYIKQPFTNNPYISEKNDEQNQNIIFQQDPQFVNQANQSIQPNTPRNPEIIQSRANPEQIVQMQSNFSKQQKQAIKQSKKNRINIPRSLKNPQNVEAIPKKIISSPLKQPNYPQAYDEDDYQYKQTQQGSFLPPIDLKQNKNLNNQSR